MTIQITCTAGELAGALNIANQVAGRGNMAPVLRSVFLSMSDGKLNIVATNTDHGIRATVAAKGSGSAFVEIELIASKIAALKSDQPVKIDGGDDAFVTVSQGRTRWKIPTIKGDGFPANFVDHVDGDAVEIDASAFIEALDVAAKAAGASGAMATENGVLVDHGATAIVGASATRMYVVDGAPDMGADIVVPRASIPAMRSIFGGESAVEMRHDKNGMAMQTDGVTYRTKLIEGTFPPWEKVLERFGANIGKSVKFDREDFSDALSRATLIREDKLKSGSALGVTLEFDGTECVIRTKNKSSEDGEDVCSASGDAGEIGVNAVILQDALSTFSGDEIELQFSDAENPIRICEPGKPENFRFIMPYRV